MSTLETIRDKWIAGNGWQEQEAWIDSNGVLFLGVGGYHISVKSDEGGYLVTAHYGQDNEKESVWGVVSIDEIESAVGQNQAWLQGA